MDDALTLAKELGACFADPLRFVLFAFPWGEQPDTKLVELKSPWKERFPGCRYGPDVWACQLLDDIGAAVKKNAFDGRHAVPPLRYAVSSGHGIGKALAVDTIVETPDGPRRWGDIRVGDYLFGPDGKPTRVIAIPFHGMRPCYRVSFDDGSSVVCSGEHLWTVRGRNQRRHGSSRYITLTTDELIERGVKRRNGRALARQWEIPRHSAVEYPPQDLLLDPYFVGLFIGNGCGTAVTYSSFDVAVHLSGILYDGNIKVAAHGDGWQTIRISEIRAELRVLGLYGCRSENKFIPECYKHAPIEDRAELFRGLFDSDGEVSKAGTVTYSTVSPRLRDDVVWLARSLGGKAQVQPTVKKAFYRGKDGKRIPGQDCYRITLTMPRGFLCGYYKERVSRIRDTVEDRYLTQWIDSIDPVGDKECQCVTVDRPDGLFLANDFIVTHNSALTAWLVCWIMATRPGCKGIVSANTANQLETKTWAEIQKWMKKSIVADMFDVQSTSIRAKESPESWRVDAITCKEENAEAFAGQHAASSTPFYIFDEASAIPDAIFEVAEGGLTDGEPMIFLFGNPTRNSGRFFNCFHRQSRYWNLRKIDSRTVAITNKRQIEEWKNEFGEDSNFFRVRVRGEFPTMASDQWCDSGLVEAAMERGQPPTNRATCAVLGVDVARFGDDDTVICTRIGKDATRFLRYNGLDTVQVVGRVKEEVRRLNHLGVRKVYVFMDEGGVGGGPVDILRNDGFPVRGVNFSQSVDDPERYPAKREEMWGRMVEWLKDGGCLPDDDALKEDLTAPTYTFDIRGRKKLESKADMKKRGLHSPDSADALAISFAYRVNEYESDKGSRIDSYLKARRDYNPFGYLNK